MKTTLPRLLLFLSIASAEPFLAPGALCPAGGERVWVACENSKEILLFDTKEGRILRRSPLPFSPSGLAASGKDLFITGAIPSGSVSRFDVDSGKITQNLPLPSGSCAPVLGEGGVLCVLNRFAGSLSLVDSVELKERARIPVGREPVEAVYGAGALYISHHLSEQAATDAVVASAVSVVDVRAGKLVSRVILPNGSTAGRGIAFLPSAGLVAVAHNLTRFDLPATQVERGWMNTAALSFLRPGENTPYATILLDDPEHGAANPWAVVVSADGNMLVVSHAGTHELSLIPIAPLLEKIRKAPDRPSLAFHLSFLYGLRTRVKTGGLGTRALAVLPSGVVSADRFSDSLCLTRGNASEPSMKRFLLRPEAELSPAQRGELAFNDATLCVQQWQSCASCHPDGRVDALNWDLLNDGLGNPKNARSLLFAHRRSPVMSHGIRATAEVAVRSGIRNILFTVQPEETAKTLDAYLKSMEPVPSPFLENGALSAKARRGKEVFASREAACASCHPAPLYTDMKLHDVGTRGPNDKDGQFLTPTLIEVWRTAPYLHDGRSATMKDALDVGQEHGKNVRRLSPEDRDALIEYVMSL